MSIKVAIVPLTPYQQNCSVIKCLATGKGALVDPGGDIEKILDAVKHMDITLEKILLTHGPASTFGRERAGNSFVADKNYG